MARTELSLVRPRRTYTKAFKAQVVAECGEPQSSIARVALAHGLNANLVHKWLRIAEARAGSEPAFVGLPRYSGQIRWHDHAWRAKRWHETEDISRTSSSARR